MLVLLDSGLGCGLLGRLLLLLLDAVAVDGAGDLLLPSHVAGRGLAMVRAAEPTDLNLKKREKRKNEIPNHFSFVPRHA